MPPASEEDVDETERRPTLSLSRLKLRASHKRAGVTTHTAAAAAAASKDQQHNRRKRKQRREAALLQDIMELPFAAQHSSFQEERKRLDELFHSSSSSSDEDNNNNNNNNKKRKIKKPSITRRRRYKDMPIPSFSLQADEVSTDTEDDDDDDDDNDLDLLLGDGKPVFATTAKAKTEQQSTTISTGSSSSSNSSSKPTNAKHSLDCKENDDFNRLTTEGQRTTTTTTSSSSSQGSLVLHNVATNTQIGQEEKICTNDMKKERVGEEEAAAATTTTTNKCWTESDILATAEQCARNTLDQSSKKFNMKVVYAELDKASQHTEEKKNNCWADIVKRSKVREHVLNRLGPSEEQLLLAVDHTFEETNVETSTVKQVIAGVQARFLIPLSSLMRERIKRRLTSLITERGCSTAQRQPSSQNNNNNGSLEVTQTALFQAVDQTFLESNIETCTLKQAVANVQARFSVSFSAETRNVIKQRLQLLINKEIQPSVQSTTSDGAPKQSLRDNSFQQDNVNQLSHQTNDVESIGSAFSSEVPGAPENTNSRNSCPEGISGTATNVTSVLDSKTFASRENGAPVNQKPVARRKARTRKPKDEITTDTKKKPATRGNRKRKSSCQLCSNCPCTLSTTDGANTKATIDLAQSDAAIEKVLIKRLQKAEKLSEQYDNQLDTVRRALKKHRREMWKKLEEANAMTDSAPVAKKSTERFLPDAGEFEQEAVRYGAALAIGTVQCAQNKIFGGESSAFQPTLTQIFRGEEKNDMENDQPQDEKANNDDGQLKTIDERPELELEDNEGEMELPGDQTNGDGEQNGSREATLNGENDDNGNDDDDDDDGLGVSTVEKIPCSRLEHCPTSISGGDSAMESVWQSMLNGNYTCTWDELFADPCDQDDDDAAMEDLLGLLGCEQSEDVEDYEDDSAKLSMLSPRGKHLAENIFEKVSNSPKTLSALEHDCPSWKENVLFGARQSDSTDVSNALGGVRMSKKKLLEARAAVLKSIDRKLAVLGVFEDVLLQSLNRLANEAD